MFNRIGAWLIAGLFMAPALLSAQSPQQRDFSVASLDGCYGTREQGDASVAAGLGIVCYDGNGNTKRSLTVNAPDGQGGRRILKFESQGTYTVEPNGTGVATYVNTVPAPSTVTFDLVITGTQVAWLPRRGVWRIAAEVFGAQREAGLTVSLVTSLQKRISDYN